MGRFKNMFLYVIFGLIVISVFGMVVYKMNAPLFTSSDRDPPSQGNIHFLVKAHGEPIANNAAFNIELHCDGNVEAKARLTVKRDSASQKHRAVRKQCDVQVNQDRHTVIGDEILFTIRDGDDHILARKVVHPEEDSAYSTDFFMP